MSGSKFSALMVVGALFGLSACNEDPDLTDPPEQFVWEARDIVSNGSGGLDFSADAFIVAVGGVVDTGIIISGAVDGTQYGWLIREGTCGSNGDPLTADPTAFPLVTIQSNGTGSVAKIVYGLLEGTEEFYVEVYQEPQFGLNLVGCGPMELVAGLPDF